MVVESSGKVVGLDHEGKRNVLITRASGKLPCSHRWEFGEKQTIIFAC